jgi:hypothetical protein
LGIIETREIDMRLKRARLIVSDTRSKSTIFLYISNEQLETEIQNYSAILKNAQRNINTLCKSKEICIELSCLKLLNICERNQRRPK